MTPVGSAIFLRQNNLASGGWASLAGQEPFKFTTLDTLKELCPLWVVSTPEKIFLTEGGVDVPFLRHSSFLPTPLTAIAEEAATGGGRAANSASAAQITSEIYTRVLGMADMLAPVSSLIVGKKADKNIRTLTSAIQALMAPMLRADPVPGELQTAVPSLFVSSSPLGTSNSSDIAIRIPANRILLFDQVMATPVPGYQWREVGLKEYPNALSWAIGEGQPIVARVSIKGPLPGVRTNAPLTGRLTQGAVRWMALPEIVALSKIIEMRAEKVFVAQELVPASASLKIPPPVFSPTAAASISAGLFAEAYMHAVSQPSLHRSQNESTSGKTQVYSLRAAWLASVARSLIVREALELSAAGFSVIGYGTSHILVSVSLRNLRNLRKAVGASKLLSYPAGLRSLEPELHVPVESHEYGQVGS